MQSEWISGICVSARSFNEEREGIRCCEIQWWMMKGHSLDGQSDYWIFMHQLSFVFISFFSVFCCCCCSAHNSFLRWKVNKRGHATCADFSFTIYKIIGSHPPPPRTHPIDSIFRLGWSFWLYRTANNWEKWQHKKEQIDLQSHHCEQFVCAWMSTQSIDWIGIPILPNGQMG